MIICLVVIMTLGNMQHQALFLLFLPVLALSQSVCIGPNQNTCYQGGWISTSSGSGRFASYQGIRYAMPPTGSLRFKPPLPYELEEGNFDVSQISDVACPQQGKKSGFSGQEDCLMLNVYVPESVKNKNSTEAANLPVMVWIYGGGFTGGSYAYSQYNPEHLVTKGVIVVAMNYRLGALGFLSMGDESVPGNAGFKDQILALSWVQENIANFGGDPGAVTIFGESAGSFSVNALVISPLANGLFRRAIQESGTTVNPSWKALNADEAIRISNGFAERIGCSQGDLTCLQDKNVDQVLGVDLSDIVNNYWLAVIDAEFTAMPTFPDDPELLLLNGDFNTDVEVIIGTNSGEGVLYWLYNLFEPSYWDAYRETYDSDGVRKLFQLSRDPTAEEIEKAHRIVDFYVGSLENVNSHITEEHIKGMVDYTTDAGFLYGSRKTLDYLSKCGVKVYQYIFSYVGEYNTACLYGHCGLGVAHAEELQYIWGGGKGTGDFNEADEAVRQMVTTAWTDFAKTGNPGLSWTPQTSGSEIQYLNINSVSPIMEYAQDIHDRMQLWTEEVGTAK